MNPNATLMLAIQRPEFFFNVMIYAMGQKSLTPSNGWVEHHLPDQDRFKQNAPVRILITLHCPITNKNIYSPVDIFISMA